jgi:hypothetical protein
MNKNWLKMLSPLLVLLATLTVSHLVFADQDGDRTPKRETHRSDDPVGAPEIDPRLAIEGLALAGGAAAILWERVRRRR